MFIILQHLYISGNVFFFCFMVITLCETANLIESYSNCNGCNEVWFSQTGRKFHPCLYFYRFYLDNGHGNCTRYCNEITRQHVLKTIRLGVPISKLWAINLSVGFPGGIRSVVNQEVSSTDEQIKGSLRGEGLSLHKLQVGTSQCWLQASQ